MKKLLLASTTVGLLAASQFATNAEAAPQTQSQLQEGVHIIQWGDTLNKISEKYDVTVDQLKNGIT
ncbi:LysM domain-containing protein [Staphylococcus chromogenes]|nr:LysM domain-containing protein [Staphylococcus chromogenes]